MKTTIIAVVVVTLCLVGAVGYGIKQSQHTKSRKPTVVTTETATANQTASPLAPAAQQGDALGVSTDSAGGAILQSNIGQQSADGTAKAVPGPETFGQYNQYIEGEHALFGDLQIGTGTEATTGKTVAVVYKGWLTNGQLFDESKIDKESGKLAAFQFKLGTGAVVQGWEEGIPGMKVGGVRRLIVPPKVGYGATGRAPIPGNAVMVFDVQLVQVD